MEEGGGRGEEEGKPLLVKIAKGILKGRADLKVHNFKNLLLAVHFNFV